MRRVQSHYSGKKNEPKPKLLGPDILRWGGGLPREGVGAKKFGMSLENREVKLFWRDNPGFCQDIPAVHEKFEKKVCVQFLVPKYGLLCFFYMFEGLGGRHEVLQVGFIRLRGSIQEWLCHTFSF